MRGPAEPVVLTDSAQSAPGRPNGDYPLLMKLSRWPFEQERWEHVGLSWPVDLIREVARMLGVQFDDLERRELL